MKKLFVLGWLLMLSFGSLIISNAATEPKYCKVKTYCYIGGMLNEIISCDSQTGDCIAGTDYVRCDGQFYQCP